MLTVGDPAARRHQFLVSLERPHDGGSFTLDTGFVVAAATRSASAARSPSKASARSSSTREPSASGMHRIDVRELNSALQSLARLPLLSAFRYQRTPAAPSSLALDVKRFADAGVLAAVADRAVATTLVTTEGRALTEVIAEVQNRAQPFLKVDAAGGRDDGVGRSRRRSREARARRRRHARAAAAPGLPSERPLPVSFVYLHAGTPFAKKGDMQMTLPKMDMPVGIVEWELFVPERLLGARHRRQRHRSAIDSE